MTITWSGGADFSGTLTSASNFWNALTVPSGKAPSEEAYLLVGVAFTMTPGTSYTSLGFAWQIDFYDVNGNAPFFSAGLHGGQAGTGDYLIQSAIQSRKLEDIGPTDDLNAGGTIRVTLSPVSGSEVISATVVACIVDGDGLTSSSYAADAFATHGGASPPHDAGFSGSINTVVPTGFVRLGGNVVGVSVGNADSSPAALPDFTGSASWTNVVSRTNGALFAGIGSYTGAQNASTPFSITYSTAYVFDQIVGMHALAPVSGARNWGTIVGD